VVSGFLHKWLNHYGIGHTSQMVKVYVKRKSNGSRSICNHEQRIKRRKLEI
jgi:hypothetical protein